MDFKCPKCTNKSIITTNDGHKNKICTKCRFAWHTCKNGKEMQGQTMTCKTCKENKPTVEIKCPKCDGTSLTMYRDKGKNKTCNVCNISWHTCGNGKESGGMSSSCKSCNPPPVTKEDKSNPVFKCPRCNGSDVTNTWDGVDKACKTCKLEWHTCSNKKESGGTRKTCKLCGTSNKEEPPAKENYLFYGNKMLDTKFS
jgi:hypothetical protein